jgi:hypothetical protein
VRSVFAAAAGSSASRCSVRDREEIEPCRQLRPSGAMPLSTATSFSVAPKICAALVQSAAGVRSSGFCGACTGQSAAQGSPLMVSVRTPYMSACRSKRREIQPKSTPHFTSRSAPTPTAINWNSSDSGSISRVRTEKIVSRQPLISANSRKYRMWCRFTWPASCPKTASIFVSSSCSSMPSVIST